MSGALNITGLISDIDWQSLAGEIIDKQKAAVIDPLEAQKTKQEAILSTWRSFNTTLSSITSFIDTSKLYKDAGFENYSASLVSANSSVNAADVIGLSIGTGTIGAGTYTIEVSQLAQAEKVSSGAFETRSTALGVSGSFDINGRTITIEAGDTLNSVAAKINDGDAEVIASILRVSDTEYRLTLESKKQGEAGIALVDTEGVLGTLGVLDAGVKNTIRAGRNALLTVDGNPITSATNTLNNVIDGASLKLTQTTAESGAITVTIEKNTDVLADSVNTLVGYINDALSFIRDQNTSYSKDSSDSTTRVLMGNSTLSSIKNRMSSIMLAGIGANETYTTASSIGISFAKNGTLSLDGDKFAAALSDKPGEVVEAVKSLSTSLKAALKIYVNPVTGNIASIEDATEARIDQIEEKIADAESLYARKADMLEARYAALQVLLDQSKRTSDWLSGQMDAMNGNK